ncbi:MAG: hypothetical protein PHN44_02335 [Candidatus Marinimicrobia bacterium]|nr:hypothetical protein [Candidatus Neomarinimicrobiota bacterium]
MDNKQYSFNPLVMPLHRFNTNRNWLAVLTGETGSGKSWTAAKIGEDLSKMTNRPFTYKNIVFEADALLEFIQKSVPRSVVVLDEAGVELAAREFMSQRNRSMGKIFQVFRYKQIALIWTLPDLSMIDVQIRKLCHTFMETQPIDYKNGKTRVKWFNIYIDRWTGDITRQFPRVRINGVTYVARGFKFGRPSPEIIEPYEKNKNIFFEKILKDARNDIAKSEGKPQVKRERPNPAPK